MFQSLEVDQGAHADLTFDSWERGWRSLLLRRYTGHREIEEVTIPPVDEQAIILVTRGVTEIESGAEGRWRSGRLTPGVIAMTAPNRPSRLRWRTISPEPDETIQLHLPTGTIARMVEELWDRDPRQARLPDTLATTDPVLEHTMLDLLQAAEGGVPDLYGETAAEYIAMYTLVRHGGLPKLRPTGTDDERVRRARVFMRESLHLPLSLAGIAAEAGMSRYHFLRVFRQQTGETPHRYLTRLRIERARRELARGSATISEIAMECGFTSRAHLTAVFRHQTGLTPSAYRLLHRDSLR